MTPLVFLTIVIIAVFGPLSLWLGFFTWRLHKEDPESDLALAVAWQMNTRNIGVVLIAVPTVFYLAGIAVPWSGQAVLLALDVLLVSGVIVAGYLRWLRR